MEKQELEYALTFCYNTKQLADYFQDKDILQWLKKYNLKPLLDSHAKDERGNSYGTLMVLDFAGRNDRGEILWKCVCQCGAEVVRSGVELRRKRSSPTCPDCLKKKLSTIKTVNHTGETHGYLTVIRPIGKTDKNILWLCKCHCGNSIVLESYKLNYNNREQLSCGCLISKGEYYINQILNKMNLKYKTQYKFSNCKNSLTGAFYKFDFCIFNEDDSINCLIEYNGRQHYKAAENGFYTEKVVKDIQFRDNEKIEYCKNQGLRLLIIPYTINTLEQIEQTIVDFL